MSTNEPLTVSEAAEALGLPKQTLRHILQRPDRRARLLHAYRNTKKGLKTVELVPVDLLDELSRSFPPVEGAEASDDDDAEAVDLQSDETRAAVAAAGQPTAATTAQTSTAAVKKQASHAVAEASRDSTEAANTTDVTAPDRPAGDELADDRVAPAPAQTSLEPFAAAEIKLGAVSRQTGDAMMIVATYERLLAEREARLLEMRSALESERANARRLADALSAAQEALAQTQEGFAAALLLSAPAAPLEATEPQPTIELPAAVEDVTAAHLSSAVDEAIKPGPLASAPALTAPLPSRRGFWARVFNR